MPHNEIIPVNQDAIRSVDQVREEDEEEKVPVHHHDGDSLQLRNKIIQIPKRTPRRKPASQSLSSLALGIYAEESESDSSSYER